MRSYNVVFVAVFLVLLLCLPGTVIVTNAQTLSAVDQEWLDAAGANNVDGMKTVLEKGANVNVRGNGSGQTALMGSVLRGHLDVVKYLLTELKDKVDVTIAEKDGYTLAHGAAFQGRADVMSFLISSNINVKDEFHSDGYAPLHRACWGREAKHTNTLRVLRDEAGIDIATMASKDGNVCADLTTNPHTKALLKEKSQKQRQEQPEEL